jgi:hypothetical protein
MRLGSARPLGILCSMAIPLAFSVIAHAGQTPDTSTRAVVAAAAAYVADYQQQLTSILADETYSQEIISDTPLEAGMPRVRHMRSEVFFMFIAGSQIWMAIRDVIAIDSEAVDRRPDVRHALRTLPTRRVAATFKDYNSRFNIGHTYRNFNEPTLSLLVFDAKHRKRFSFTRERVHADRGTVLVTLTFQEKDSPTLIGDLDSGRVFSTGEMVVEAATGRVRSAVIEAETDEVKSRLETTYGRDERLGIWVPTVFRERYVRDEPRMEEIVCEARYTNFRRFETTVRIR